MNVKVTRESAVTIYYSWGELRLVLLVVQISSHVFGSWFCYTLHAYILVYIILSVVAELSHGSFPISNLSLLSVTQRNALMYGIYKGGRSQSGAFHLLFWTNLMTVTVSKLSVDAHLSVVRDMQAVLLKKFRNYPVQKVGTWCLTFPHLYQNEWMNENKWS